MRITLLVIMAILLPVAAFAQETDTTVKIGALIAPWADMIVSTVAVLIGALVTWITALISRKTGIEIEARHREALQSALTNGAGLVLSKITVPLSNLSMDVKSPLVKIGVEYVLNAAPDAVKKFGLSPDELAEKLVAKLGLASSPALPAQQSTQ